MPVRSLLLSLSLSVASVLPGSVSAAAPGDLPLDLTAQAVVAPDDVVLVFPQDPTVTTFDDTWGHARSSGRRHKGTDLMAPKMSPVYAVADGVITLMRSGGSAGRWLALEHAGGMESWYMHLNNDTPGTDDGRADSMYTYAPGLSVGDFVAAGQLIGYVGDSGNAEGSGAHTHFELHVDGRPVDPYEVMAIAHERALEVARLQDLAAVMELLD